MIEPPDPAAGGLGPGQKILQELDLVVVHKLDEVLILGPAVDELLHLGGRLLHAGRVAELGEGLHQMTAVQIRFRECREASVGRGERLGLQLVVALRPAVRPSITPLFLEASIDPLAASLPQNRLQRADLGGVPDAVEVRRLAGGQSRGDGPQASWRRPDR